MAVGDSRDNPVRFRGAAIIPDEDKCGPCLLGVPIQRGTCPQCGEEWESIGPTLELVEKWKPVLAYLKNKSTQGQR